MKVSRMRIRTARLNARLAQEVNSGGWASKTIASALAAAIEIYDVLLSELEEKGSADANGIAVAEHS